MQSAFIIDPSNIRLRITYPMSARRNFDEILDGYHCVLSVRRQLVVVLETLWKRLGWMVGIWPARASALGVAAGLVRPWLARWRPAHKLLHLINFRTSVTYGRGSMLAGGFDLGIIG